MSLKPLLVVDSQLDLGAEIFDERLSATVYMQAVASKATQYFLTVNLT